MGNDVTLAALDCGPLREKLPFLRLFPIGVGPNALGRSPLLRRWLAHRIAGRTVDIIHNHGMWQMNSVYPGQLVPKGNAKLVVSPRGAFSAWAMNNGSRVKLLFWPLLQRPALVRAACFHATAETEYQEIRRLGFAQPVAIIPNGIDVPALQPKPAGVTRTLLYLGRIHPKKGIDLLLAAWATVMDSFPDWQLEITGSDTGYGAKSGYQAQMQALAGRLQLKRVCFTGPVYGEKKLAAYRRAELFVLPTHSENFGMTVAEALAAGTAAIVSKGAPWHGLEIRRAGWWIDIGVDPLVDCLRNAMAQSPAALAGVGTNGRDWMLNDFSWDMVGKSMARTYEWLLEGGPTPSWVRLD
jgi:glycosyltransferase involved in cell wall biosynthesis